MRILGLMGSPKKKGNADLLLDRAMQGAESAGAQGEKVLVAELKIAPCLACGGCERTGECVVHDDMQEVYPKLTEADGIIVSTPVFFMGLPAQLKALVDRCQPFWARKHLLAAAASKKRAGLLIAVGGTNFPHTFDAIRLEVKSFFHCLEVKYAGELLFPGIEGHGEIANHPEALSRAYQAGKELAHSLSNPLTAEAQRAQRKMNENQLSREIIAAALEVHKALGPGLLESAYEECLAHEFSLRRLPFVRQVPLPITYKDVQIEPGFRLDFIVDNLVVIEVKSVETLLPIHEAQVLTYLKLTGKKLALLINFNQPLLRQGIKRIVLDLPE